MNELSSILTHDKVFYYPNIPEKKLIKTMEKMKVIEELSDIIGLYDNTIFGGGGDGILLTNKRVYGKESFMDPKSLEYIGITSIIRNGKKILINGMEFCDCTFLDKNEIDKLIEIITILKSKDSSQKINYNNNKDSELTTKINTYKDENLNIDKLINENFFSKLIKVSKKNSNINKISNLLDDFFDKFGATSPEQLNKAYSRDVLSENKSIKQTFLICEDFVNTSLGIYKIAENDNDYKSLKILLDSKFTYELLIYLNFRTYILVLTQIDDHQISNAITQYICGECILKNLIYPYIQFNLQEKKMDFLNSILQIEKNKLPLN